MVNQVSSKQPMHDCEHQQHARMPGAPLGEYAMDALGCSKRSCKGGGARGGHAHCAEGGRLAAAA